MLDALFRLTLLVAELMRQLFDDRGSRDVTISNRGVERFDIWKVQFVSEFKDRLPGQDLLQRHTRFAHLTRNRLLPGLDGLFAPLFGEPRFNLRAGAGRFNKVKPVTARGRIRTLIRNDIDDISVC